jgi:ubiquinone/menaquinone biosynthesis C-methylase UbiE
MNTHLATDHVPPNAGNQASQAHIAKLMQHYYTAYYRDTLGLPDWQARVARRMVEDTDMVSIIQKFAGWVNLAIGRAQQVLVVGAGTGADFMAFHQLGCEVYGVEPSPAASRIGSLKADTVGYNPSHWINGRAEELPFGADTFDIVWSWTVLEHVQHVEHALDEMIRTCKPSGFIFIMTPNYCFPYEGHYKLTLIPFAPKWVQSLYLRLLRRPVGFLKSINFVTSRQLDRLFWRRNVVAIRLFEPHLYMWRELHTVQKWFCQTFGIQKTQWIILRKIG